MSKSKKTAVAAPEATAPEAAPKTRKVTRLVLTGKSKNFRDGTARAAWWSRIQTLDGATMEEVRENVLASPPWSEDRMERHSGDPKLIAGWVGFFVRQELVKTVTAEVAAE